MSTILSVTAGTGVEANDARATPESVAEGKPKAEATVNWERPDTLQECIELFGEKVVLEHFEAQALRNLGNRVRADLANGDDEETIKVRYENGGYVPGETRTATPEQKVFQGFNSMSADEQANSLRKLLEQSGVPEEQIEAAIAAHYERLASTNEAQTEAFEDVDEEGLAEQEEVEV